MRKTVTRCRLSLFLWLVPLLVSAQIQVSFPLSRMVLQRSTANTAAIHIAGYYTSTPLARVEAQLVLRDGQGTAVGWTTIQTNPSGGVYAGDLTAQGGWYDVQVRGIGTNGQTYGPTVVERVGVGEVFVVSGQSNAQGIQSHPNGSGANAPGATSDHVNCVNLYTESQGDPPLPVFSHLDAGTNIAPTGVNAWCWGALGDLLTQRLNVPILFLNGSWGATCVRNWEESYTNGTTNNIYSGLPFPAGQPYASLRTALKAYTHMLGVRAVLWHQGEADNQQNLYGGYTAAQYTSRLSGLINKTRQDTGKPIVWVVARVSYSDDLGSNGNILNAQNNVIANTANVYAGPNTDLIQIPRNTGNGDPVHFDPNGLIRAANAWNASLTDGFFSAAQPQLPATMPGVSAACAANNQLQLSVGGYASVSWFSGQGGSPLVAGAGQYQAKVKDNLGNISYSPTFNVPSAPGISAPNGTVVCGGNTVTLTANTANVTWNNGTQGQSITVGASGAFSASYNNDASGCPFVSNTVNITVNAIPPAPTVTAQKPTVFCTGDNTVLASTGAVKYNWSNGSQSQQNTISTSGTYFLTITDGNGCTSPASNSIVVTANPTPAKPVVSATGPLTFCVDKSLTISAPDVPAGTVYAWTGGQTSQSIAITQSGQYAVKLTNSFNCTSASSDIANVTINPLPATPTIQALGATTFCDGNQLGLQVNTGLKPLWSNGGSTNPIQVTTSGIYNVKVQDGNGCISLVSNSIPVTANPTPAKPVVSATGPLTFCVDKSLTISAPDVPAGTVYAWTGGQTSQSISITQSGQYAVKLTNSFNCTSPSSDVANVTINPLPATPTIQALGATTFCDGNQLGLQVNTGLKPLWSNGGSTNPIQVTTSGIYNVKVQDGNGCISLVSNSIPVTVNPTPAKPTIAASGPLTFCADSQVVLTAPTSASYNWSNGLITAGISINQPGQFSVRVINSFNCPSASSDPVRVVVNPLPATPTIQPQSATTFCDGGQVTLRTNTTLKPIWTTGETTSAIVVSKTGNYSVRVQDNNGCLSLAAAAVLVDAKPLPPLPTVQQLGAYILQAGDPTSNATYRWTLEKDTLALTTNEIKVIKSGTYAASSFIRYSSTLTCYSARSVPYFYALPTDNGQISVYPNPSPAQLVNVETFTILNNVSISVYTLWGQRVFSTTLAQLAGSLQLNLTGLMPGEYVIRLEADGFRAGRRVLVGIY